MKIKTLDYSITKKLPFFPILVYSLWSFPYTFTCTFEKSTVHSALKPVFPAFDNTE